MPLTSGFILQHFPDSIKGGENSPQWEVGGGGGWETLLGDLLDGGNLTKSNFNHSKLFQSS